MSEQPEDYLRTRGLISEGPAWVGWVVVACSLALMIASCQEWIWN